MEPIQTDLPDSPDEFYSSTVSQTSRDAYSYLSSPGGSRKAGPGSARGFRGDGSKSPAHQQYDDGATATFNQTTFNAVNLLLGVGILSLPFAVKTSGWLICIPLLLFLSFVTNYTGKLIGRCLAYKRGMQSFADIGFEAFGIRGRRLISFLLFTELFTACCMYLILMGDNLHSLFPFKNEKELMLISFMLILPTTWTRELTWLSYISIIGIISSYFLLGVTVYVGATSAANITDADTGQPLGGSFIHSPPGAGLLIQDADRIPLVLGLVMIGFAGHAVFPSIYSSMANKRQYPTMLNVTYGTTVSCYLLMAVFGYLMYGDLTDQEITLNIYKSYPGTLSKLMTWLIVINPYTKFALTMNPVACALEENLGISGGGDDGHGGGKKQERVSQISPRNTPPASPANNTKSYGSVSVNNPTDGRGRSVSNPTRHGKDGKDGKDGKGVVPTEGLKASLLQHDGGAPDQRASSMFVYKRADGSTFYKCIPTSAIGKKVCSALVRSMLSALICLVAISVPNFARVVAFIGGFCSFAVSVIFPCAAFLALCKKDEMGKGRRRMKQPKANEKIWNWFLIALCAVFAVVGTLASVMSPTE